MLIYLLIKICWSFTENSIFILTQKSKINVVNIVESYWNWIKKRETIKKSKI